jgi:hypothetical protein
MPAVTVDNPLALPRLTGPSADTSVPRPVELVMSAHEQTEQAGVQIWRPFPGELALEDYQAGRLGTIPADQLTPRNYA